MVLVSLEKGSRTRQLVIDVRSFAVNVLAEGQEAVARGFSRAGRKPFEHTKHHLGRIGAPLLDDALAWLECRVDRNVDAGDHDVVIADVLASGARDGAPLVYFNRAYRSLSH